MPVYLLGIDGGGSKTLALLCDAQGVEMAQASSGPAHLTNDLPGACDTVIQLITTVLQQAKLTPAQIVLVVGIAGAGDERLKQHLLTALKPDQFAGCYVTTDAKTSLHGANSGAPVVAIALGTGSVAMRLDQRQQEQQVGGWGFSIGDEGGGAAMGKAAVRAALWEQDCHPDNYSSLAQYIFSVIGQNKTDMLTWLRQANANQYAALAPRVIELAGSCKAALGVLHKHAADVELLIKATRADTELPVVVLGGLAAATVPYLSATVQSWCQSAKADSVHGAILIARQLAEVAKPGMRPLPAATCDSDLSAITLARQLSQLPTESRAAIRLDLAGLDTESLLTVLNQADQTVPHAVALAIPQVAQLVDRIVNAFAVGGRLIYLGAGTSGRLGVLDAVECPPTFSVKPEQVMGLIAGGHGAMFRAKEGAEDDEALAITDLAAIGFCAKDVLVGIAASGRTPYVIAGLRFARSLGALTAGISCNPATEVLSCAELAICAAVGPEVLSGSTRLKAGTAQKLLLNMISTAAMVRSGKVYQDLMVDLHASNAKLKARALNIICQATGCTLEDAGYLLQHADQSVKLAILLYHCAPDRHTISNTDVQAANALLQQTLGQLQRAIQLLPAQPCSA
ncbi:N-acetylmuramic acid 6-phosphate etherase [Rheinheimera sp. F8]|uniref:N-acetylmuramic acid 6-phosphate etherase n=1 Tax=Rheinheimera sp. F8 TaxID=1763998 RepID=UPI001AD8456B|nr:N-acetylmuramic acid 6-phosphate etherase [Rheinheimera sp. F8]